MCYYYSIFGSYCYWAVKIYFFREFWAIFDTFRGIDILLLYTIMIILRVSCGTIRAAVVAVVRHQRKIRFSRIAAGKKEDRPR